MVIHSIKCNHPKSTGATYSFLFHVGNSQNQYWPYSLALRDFDSRTQLLWVGSRHELLVTAYRKVVTKIKVSMIQPIHANASIAVRTRHALNWEQNDGRLGQML